MLRRLRGLDVSALRGDRPVDGWRSGEPDDDWLESDHVTSAWVPRWWYQVWVVRLIDGIAVCLEGDAPRRRPSNAVVHLASVRAKNVDRHHPDIQRMVIPLFERLGCHWQHPVSPPPSDDRPRPSDSVTLQHSGAVEGDDDGRALLADNVRGSRGWVWTTTGMTSTRVREVEEQEEHEDEEEHQPKV